MSRPTKCLNCGADARIAGQHCICGVQLPIAENLRIEQLESALAKAEADLAHWKTVAAGACPLDSEMVYLIREVTDAAGYSGIPFLDDCVKHLVAERDEALAALQADHRDLCICETVRDKAVALLRESKRAHWDCGKSVNVRHDCSCGASEYNSRADKLLGEMGDQWTR